MKKIFAVVGLIMLLSFAAFGYSQGITFGADYTLEGASLGTFAGVEVGRDDHNFELNVGTSELLDNANRYLWFDAEYFIGYIRTSLSPLGIVSKDLVTGVSVGLDTVFEPYEDWATDSMDIDALNFFVRGEVFDLVPELWATIAMYGQLDIGVQTGSTMNFGGKIGVSVKLPW